MAYRCPRCGGEVDLARTPLESGLLRLAVLGPDDFVLSFDDPRLHATAAPLLGPCPHGDDPEWDVEALRPLAERGWQALLRAADDDPRLETLASLWRPQALRLLGRTDELSKEEALRARLQERLEDLRRRMDAARAAGDDEQAELLHARYIELGMVFAGRMAAAWAT
jgi:hypothetical protein